MGVRCFPPVTTKKMYKINDRLATHGFNGNCRVTNIAMSEEDLEQGFLEDFQIVDVRTLQDGLNRISDYRYHIQRAIDILRDPLSGKAVICCDAGQSRSNAIALGVLVLYFDMEFWDAEKLIEDKVPIALIDPYHLDSLKRIFGVNIP